MITLIIIFYVIPVMINILLIYLRAKDKTKEEVLEHLSYILTPCVNYVFLAILLMCFIEDNTDIAERWDKLKSKYK